VEPGERTVSGGHTPAGVAAVHDVVVEQRGGLEELHRRRQPDQRVGVGAAGRAVAPVEEARAQPLAAGDEALDGVDERAELVADRGEDGSLHLHLGVHGRLDPRSQVAEVERADHGRSFPGAGDIPACGQGTGPFRPARDLVAPAHSGEANVP
jgi:hypothetical protein